MIATTRLRLLVSARSAEEALAAAAAGADIIDLKEPRAGALGGLPVAGIRQIVDTLRKRDPLQVVSATIGEMPPERLEAIVEAVHAVADCGVDYVKVGVAPGPAARPLLQALARCDTQVVPVFVADDGLEQSLIKLAHSLPFPALLLDTADKAAGSLFDCVDEDSLRRFIQQTRRAGRLAGLAGALRFDHLAQLWRLGPDIAGFRTAVCNGDRSGELDPARVRELASRFRGERSAW
jgi:(5-formylfuran-3-yl)methyl phosphate synthase